ncbi:sensor histidine kinase [Kitasatospora hibisci]|uniref:sensor histidine kinase n=1 Tax=Kitasatospora hibisci TaxID=3369522 RepID=UPI003755389A
MNEERAEQRRRWTRSGREIGGPLLSVLFVLIGVRETWASPDLRGPMWANALCLVAMAQPLATCGRLVVSPVLVALAGMLVQTVRLTPSTGLVAPLVAAVVAAYSAGRNSPRRRTALVLLAVVVGVEWAGPVAVNHDPVGDWLFAVVAAWAGWLLGRDRRAREELTRQRIARAEAERARKGQVAAAVAAERQAVARDLHDTVAHAVTLMVLQATGTRLVARTDPAAAEAALASVETVGRQAMDDLRTMLHVLRREDEGPEGEAPPAPGLGLDDLPGLVDGARGAGLEVRLDLPDADPVLPRAQATAVYRTVQEGLTNAARHAPGSRVHVAVMARRDRVTVTVGNEAPPHAGPPLPAGAGTGLVGLRERVTALGGTLRTHGERGDAFVVTATIPRTGQR